jgi:hypothetical protein
MTLLALAALLSAGAASQGGDAPERGRPHYVAPNGSPDGDGSGDRPWDLETALYRAPGVRPGDTIYLRRGTYVEGRWDSSARRNLEPGRRGPFGETAPIRLKGVVVRSAPGERAVIDGGFLLGPEASGSTWRDLEVTCSDPRRRAEDPGRPPPRPAAFAVNAPNVRILNNVIHDTSPGVAAGGDASGTEIYGNLIYFTGFSAPDRGHGPGISFQSRTGPLRMEDNLVFDAFGAGVEGRSEDGAGLNDVSLVGNVVFQNGSLRGAFGQNLWVAPEAESKNLVVEANLTYFAEPWGRTRIGGESAAGTPSLTGSRIRGNAFMDGSEIQLLNCGRQISGNAFRGRVAWVDGGQARDEASFRTAFPLNTFLGAARPSGLQVFLRRNRYQVKRAHVAVYNWERAEAVEVDLGKAGFGSGDFFVIRAAQDLAGRQIVGAYDGKPVLVPMTGWGVAKPVGGDAPASTFPEFGAFLVTRE